MSRAYADGILREQWDDQTRTYTVYDKDGKVTSTRPYTSKESQAVDAEAAIATRASNEQTLRAGLITELDKALQRQTELTTIIDATNATINANPATYIKGLARAQRRHENALMRLIRIVGDLTDSTNIGTDQ